MRCRPNLQLGIVLLLAMLSLGVAAQSKRVDGGKFVSHENTTLEQLTCHGKTVQFARGLRWTPPDHGVQLSAWPAGRPASGDGSIVELPGGCYTDMSCVVHEGRPSLLLVLAPACGGNAVPEEYLVFNLANLRHKVLDYRQARAAGLIRY